MPSLAILEGLIGTGCAVACLYYARTGALAGGRYALPTGVPWHSALGEYARRNPFAAVFAALAFGFLVSSWSMYALPRPVSAEARAIEKWHTITKTVPTPDPAQAVKIMALQTTINADAATIAGQNAELDRLKQLLAKYTSRRAARSANARAAETKENPSPSEGTAAALNKSYNPANAAAGGAPSSQPPPATTQTPATPPADVVEKPSGAPQNSANPPPH